MKLFSPYSKQSVWWICKKKSEHKWKAPIGNRTKNGTGCPSCKRSKMEETMVDVLKQLSIDFNQELKAKINNRTLRYDFYLPKYNLYIECQGCQHFHPNYYFNRTDKNLFDDLINRDLSKIIYVRDIKASFVSLSYRVSLNVYRQIISDIIKIDSVPIYRFYYDQNRFWEIQDKQKQIPDLVNTCKDIVDIYETQFTLFN